MDFDIVVIINCGSISNEYLVMRLRSQKNVESMGEEELCNNWTKQSLLMRLSAHVHSIPYTVLQAIPNIFEIFEVLEMDAGANVLNFPNTNNAEIAPTGLLIKFGSDIVLLVHNLAFLLPSYRRS